MANKTISGLTAAATFAATDNLAAAVSGNTRRVTGTVLANFLSTATLAAGTITTSQPMTLTQTWNAGAITFTAFKINISSSASAAASLLLDLQLASVSQWNVTKAGAVTQLGSLALAANGLTLSFGASSDVILNRDAANTLALRNGATAQTLRIYGSFTDASNGDWLSITKAAGGNTTIATTVQGTGAGTNLIIQTGTNGSINFAPAGTIAWVIGIGGSLSAQTDNSFDIGASGANRPRTLYLGTSIVTPGGASFHTTSTALTDGSAAQVATMTNGPTAGNPTKWIGINDNGTVRQIPSW